MATVPRRKEPLANLKKLTFWAINDQSTTSAILSIFKHCPNIKELGIPNFAGSEDVGVISKFLEQRCPQLRLLSCQSFKKRAKDRLPYKVMNYSLPANLRSLSTFGQAGYQPNDRTTRGALRRIVIVQYSRFTRISIPVPIVFKQCCNLTILHLGASDGQGLYVDLDDVLEVPWSFTKLKNLSLALSGCELPSDPTPESLPYYSRPRPILLSEAEKQQFARLEKLYKQIGKLTELKYLHLEMVKLEEQSQIDQEAMSEPLAFLQC
ncbi:hypothetical protein BGX23_006665 [Mortierella sp. AD031]|nr:hypothetical protein BGX23_006665 [Mortierella sp. AD031]